MSQPHSTPGDTHQRLSACIHIHVCACACIYIHVCACAHMHVDAYACVRVCERVFMCVCVHMRVSGTRVDVYTRVHTLLTNAIVAQVQHL